MMPISYSHPRTGFSLFELVMTIALVAVVSTAMVWSFSGTLQDSRGFKLERDVRHLNHLLRLYEVDGGSLLDAGSMEVALNKLKNYRPERTVGAHTGAFSGSLLDGRMIPDPAPLEIGERRAVWNNTSKRFEVATQGAGGTRGFIFDEEKADYVGREEARPERTVVQFDQRAGEKWIWGAPVQEAAQAVHEPTGLMGSAEKVDFDPQQANPLQAGGGGNGGDPTGPGDGGGPPNPAAPLPEPTVMPGGGTYPHQDFPATVTISSNGAPAGDSILEWRINDGPWVSSGGSSVTVNGGDRLQARNVPAPGVTTYAASAVVTHEYYRMVDGFNASVEATFVYPQGGAGLNSQVVNEGGGRSIFTHGSETVQGSGGLVIGTGGSNTVTFNSSAIEGVRPNTWFTLGEMEVHNAGMNNAGEANGVTLRLTINMANGVGTGTVDLGLQLISTPDTGSRAANADVIRLLNADTGYTVQIDGVNYRLEVGWVHTDPRSGYVRGEDFFTFEGATSSGRLRGRLVSE